MGGRDWQVGAGVALWLAETGRWELARLAETGRWELVRLAETGRWELVRLAETGRWELVWLARLAETDRCCRGAPPRTTPALTAGTRGIWPSPSCQLVGSVEYQAGQPSQRATPAAVQGVGTTRRGVSVWVCGTPVRGLW